MANQMGAAPSLHDAASLHDSYMRSTSPCATHTCPTRLLAYKPHIVRTANGRAPVTACSTHVERRLRAGCGSAEDRPAVPERVLPLSADSSALAILYREDTASQPPCASRRRRAAAAAARAAAGLAWKHPSWGCSRRERTATSSHYIIYSCTTTTPLHATHSHPYPSREWWGLAGAGDPATAGWVF